MKNHHIITVIIFLSCFFISSQTVAALNTNANNFKIPILDPNISPLAEKNRPLLFKRITATFDSKYQIRQLKNAYKDLFDASAAYYLPRELQALIDMWRATKNPSYLTQAKKIAFKAIADAQKNQHILLWHDQERGTWPCFFAKDNEKVTGGHGQLYDFQCSAGLMMVADSLYQTQRPGWQEIADFVETQIITKWLSRNPNIKLEDLTGPKSAMYLLITLDSGRDKREHFATICMDLYKLGYRRYPYQQWSEFLTQTYLGNRSSLEQLIPNADKLGNSIPKPPQNWDWGIIPNKATGGFIWYWTIDIVIEDTSHANRTVWLATKAYYEGFIDQIKLNGFINTLKYQVWSPDKGPFYFNNFIDGTDKAAFRMGPGEIGNVWFGWHRLAAYDETLKELFISMAYDLTNNGPNIVGQNKGMEEAPLCLLAWGARLLAADGEPQKFP